jgi:hypothetical protein
MPLPRHGQSKSLAAAAGAEPDAAEPVSGTDCGVARAWLGGTFEPRWSQPQAQS